MRKVKWNPKILIVNCIYSGASLFLMYLTYMYIKTVLTNI